MTTDSPTGSASYPGPPAKRQLTAAPDTEAADTEKSAHESLYRGPASSDTRSPDRRSGPADESNGRNERLAAWITAKIGSMWTVYICLAVTVIWMLLASRQVLGFDPYPYPFLLFLGNVAQLLLIFIILLGQQVLGRTADRRSLHTYQDAEAILVDCEQIQNHLIAQDAHLLPARIRRAAEHQALASAAERIEPTSCDRTRNTSGFNGRLAAWLTSKVGTMTAFYAAAVFQVAWIIAGQLLGFDPYPYLFLLFLSSQTQLILMFVIMVGQQVLGQQDDKRAAQTYLNTQAVLHALRAPAGPPARPGPGHPPHRGQAATGPGHRC